MEYHLTKKSIDQLSTALNTVVEQPVDIDLTLPDYCPDIERILSCELIPKIYMTNLGSDRLNVEGGSCVRILYIDGERGCMRSYEYTQPFSESIPIGDHPDNCAAVVEAKPEYLNCRALSPRKLSLHGAVSLHSKVYVADGLDYYSYSDGGDLQVKSESINASDLCGLCTESFSVQEEIPVGANIVIGVLLSHRLYAKITELKAIHNKIMLNAELKLELMYLSDIENKQVDCMSYSLPVSRVIDCDGADDNSVIDGRLDVMSDELRLGGDALDGSALLSLEAKLSFSALCYSEKEIDIISDAFSTERDAQPEYAPFSCVCGTIFRSYTDIGKSTADVDDTISKVIDVHCEKLTVDPTSADGRIILNTKLCVGMLYENTDGETKYIEREAEFIYTPDTDGRDHAEAVCAGLDSLSYRMADGHRVELRAEICYRLTLCRRMSCSAVTRITADDDAPSRSPEGSLILYYTDGGENVWDISKRFSSRPEDIISENGLDGDSIDNGVMLLIPTT